MSIPKVLEKSTEKPLDVALAYAARGWPVFPLHTPKSGKCDCRKDCQSIGKHPRTMKGLKDATTDPDRIRKWWDMWPDANIGVAMGERSGVFALDVDPRHGGNESLAALQVNFGPIPDTRIQRTGGGGRHHIFRHVPGLRNSAGALGEGLDIRSEGGYIVVAPSIHASGGRYEWLNESEIAEAPGWLIDKLKTSPPASTPAAGESIPEGRRNVTLTAAAGKMRRQGFTEAEILGALLTMNRDRCTPPLDESEVATIARSVGRYAPAETITAGPGTQKRAAGQQPPAADIVNHKAVLSRILAKIDRAEFEKLAVEKQGLRKEGDNRSDREILKEHETKQKHQIVLCVLHLLNTVRQNRFELARKNDFIFVYNGQYWREIEKEEVTDFLGQAAEKMGVFCLESQHYEYRNKLYNQFLSAARFQPVEADKKKVLINLQNGTFEITAKSQSLREFRAEDFLHHQLPFEYDEAAKAPLFEKYLERVLPSKNVQGVIAEFLGYVFTRNLKLEKSLLLYGSGANGKSVLFDIMNALLGRENITNYSLSDLIEEHNRARIANKLLNYGSEINASAVRDVFKNLVSGEPIMARLKYGNSFMMEDYAKLCFNCNELPKDIEQSDAYFRRLIIAHFGVTIPEAEQDKQLAQKIIDTELAGVFNWILAGLRRVLKQNRFSDCPETESTLLEYRKESDTVAMFLDEEGYEKSADGHMLQKDLHKIYKEYCLDAGYKPLGRNNFGKRLKSLRFTIDRSDQGVIVYVKRSEKKCSMQTSERQERQDFALIEAHEF